MSKRSTKKKPSAPAAASKETMVYDDQSRVVILYGPEFYLHTEHLRKLREHIAARHGEPEVIRFDGASASATDVLDEARSFGLMQQYKIIVVDQADQFVKTSKADEEPDTDDASGPAPAKASPNRRLMERYCESPVEHVTIVLRASTWRPGNLDKLVAKIGQIVKCEAPQEMDKAIRFCIQRCEKRYACTITTDAAQLLIDRVGLVLARLDMELSRLALMVEPGGKGLPTITVDLVREQITLSREEAAWEVQLALLSGERELALSKVRELLTISRQPTELLFYCMADLARKLYGASRLLEQGEAEFGVIRRLKLWSDAGKMVPRLARNLPQPALAQLMHDSIAAMHRPRTGLGDAARGVEMLAVRFLTVLDRPRR